MEFERENVVGIYSEISGHFSRTRHYKWNWVEGFIRALPDGSEVLDIGCGNGRNMENTAHRFVGIDNCPEFVDMCREDGKEALIADMCDMPFGNNMFDAVISVASFHHLSNISRRLDAMNEIHRVLKPGGTCLLSVWAKDQPEKTRRKFPRYGENFVPWKTPEGKEYKRYYHIFRIPELTSIAKLCGLTIIKHETICGNEVFTLKK